MALVEALGATKHEATMKERGVKRKSEATQEPTPSNPSSPTEIEVIATETQAMDGPSQSLSPPPSKKRKRQAKDVEEIEVDIYAPEPPSKKALRRAKKGKTLPIPTPKDIETSIEARNADTDEESEETERKEEPSKRSEYGIWIGNLPFTTTKADLRKFLTENSEITDEHITRIHLPVPSENDPSPRQKIKPQNKGFAYIDFKTSTALDEALGLSETLLTGRRVLIKNSKSFEGRPEKSTNSDGPSTTLKGNKPPSKRIFVGNLGFDTTKEDLEEHFRACGDVADVHMATFEDTGKCKGFAWIEFGAIDAGEAAIRGWVKIPEEQESESEDEEAEGGEDGKIADKKKKKKAPKMRKWWVNRIKGRPLRMEFAEDKAVRYKKRFGKDGTAKRQSATDATSNPDVNGVDGEAAKATNTAATEAGSAPPSSRSTTRPMGNAGAHHQRKIDARTVKPGAALAAAPRLTGAIVEGKGKKTTFD
ncbi:MAG: hypothetical protein M1836_002748 [Candelina mexicana]|nr:MAG: hypothetical protein M1836_002748 [Candelina mexicana]